VTREPATVSEVFAESAARHHDRSFVEVLAETAAVYGIAPRLYSYADAACEVERLRSVYAEAGYGAGHRAGLLLHNRPEFLFHWFALNSLGVSVVPVNPDWRAAELEYLVAHSEIALAVAERTEAAALERAAAAIGRPLVVTTPHAVRVDDAPVRASTATSGSQTECALLYTSGTTGRPKGCMLPNEYFLTAGRWYAQVGGMCEIRPAVERMITPLPLTHMNAMAFSVMCTVLSGGCLVLLDRFHPQTWWDSVRSSRATVMHYLGVMPAMLLALPESPDDRSHELRFGFGAGVNPRHHAVFESRFGVPLLEAWAMTETGAGAVMIANREPRQVGTACFGRAEPRIEFRLAGEDGRNVARGTPGELLVRGAGAAPRSGFFAGYLKDDTATAESWRDGWFHTGDLVRLGDDGQFHFVDRRRNVIRRSGENISAVEVEAVLVQHPAVASVGVTAVPDPVRGDEVMACVVPNAGLSAIVDPGRLAAELVGFCMQRLAYFKAPGFVAFCESLPLTSTAKIQRGQLAELGRALQGAPGCVDTRGMKKRQA
jgi:acyl-CoA synthetase (AMP-forming)/AMP-acid ligase II